jgi:transcriptional regulator with XRE-family HTH domain
MFVVPAQVAEFPELSTTEHWRDLMERSRRAAKLTQRQLADKVHVSQNVISMIESGRIKQSKYILPICDELKIPPPHVLFEDEVEQRWVEAGRRLRKQDPRVFQAQLEAMERMVAALGRSPTEH